MRGGLGRSPMGRALSGLVALRPGFLRPDRATLPRSRCAPLVCNPVAVNHEPGSVLLSPDTHCQRLTPRSQCKRMAVALAFVALPLGALISDYRAVMEAARVAAIAHIGAMNAAPLRQAHELTPNRARYAGCCAA